MSQGHPADYQLGETIFQERTVGAWLHLVLNGRIRILRKRADGRDLELGTARSGELLGDYVLLPPHHHTASCRAREPARVLRLPLVLLLEQLLAAQPGVGPHLKRFLRLHAVCHFLREQPFLGFMSGPSALTYLNLLHAEQHHAARTIQAPGIAEDRWYFLQQGQVGLQEPSGALRVLEPGDCFGAQALLGQAGPPVAVSLTDTLCLSLPRQAFEDPEHFARPLSQTLDVHQRRREDCPWVAQQTAADCGLAALVMAANISEIPLTFVELRAAREVPPQGLSLLQLRDLACQFGLEATALRVDREHWQELTLPTIAHLQDGHYVVIFGHNYHSVLIGDPATGVLRMAASEFCQRWSGYCLHITASHGWKP